MNSRRKTGTSRLWYRHQLVHARPGSLLRAHDLGPDKGDAAVDSVAREWLGLGRPLMVAAPCLLDDGLTLSTFFPLPPEQGRRRLGVEIAADDVLRVSCPPALTSVRELFPVLRQVGYDRLLAVCQEANVRAWVVGSYTWRILTGLAYVNGVTGVELVLDVPGLTAWRDLLPRLRELTPETLPLPTEIEILLDRESAFSWWEYLDDSPEMLLQTNRQRRMVAKEFLEQPAAAGA